MSEFRMTYRQAYILYKKGWETQNRRERELLTELLDALRRIEPQDDTVLTKITRYENELANADEFEFLKIVEATEEEQS